MVTDPGSATAGQSNALLIRTMMRVSYCTAAIIPEETNNGRGQFFVAFGSKGDGRKQVKSNRTQQCEA